MRIQRVEVRNFRALRNSDFNLGGATALLGENNSGKSAFLLALDLFFSSSPRVGPKDFSDENVGAPIDITVHFAELTPGELEEFGGNLLNGRLVVTRRFYADNPAESGKFSCSASVPARGSRSNSSSRSCVSARFWKTMAQARRLSVARALVTP